MSTKTTIDYIITNGYVDTDTIASMRGKGHRFITTVPAIQVLPTAMPTDMATIYAVDEVITDDDNTTVAPLAIYWNDVFDSRLYFPEPWTICCEKAMLKGFKYIAFNGTVYRTPLQWCGIPSEQSKVCSVDQVLGARL